MVSTLHGEMLSEHSADLILSTLHESIWHTFKRDAQRILLNSRVVLWHFGIREGGNVNILREWDLWGPLVFVLVLGTCLTADAQDATTLFSIVFWIIVFGSVALTLNVLLLRGRIIFLQAISLTGYCVFPLNIAVLLMKISHYKTYRTMLASAAVIFSVKASSPFISAAVPGKRTALAMFPIILLHVSLTVLAVFSV